MSLRRAGLLSGGGSEAHADLPGAHRGSAAREHTILRIGRLSRKNEHVNLRVVCPHHCSNQRIPSPHSEPQGVELSPTYFPSATG